MSRYKKMGLSISVPLILLVSCMQVAQAIPDPPFDPRRSGLATAVLAGGCFWGVEAIFESLNGVKEAVSGYAGGSKPNPSYEEVSTGATGHAEAVLVSYDASVISYGTLLKVFFAVAHDPTQLNYQGPDHGSQYRSAVFYSDPVQKETVERYISALNDAKAYPGRVVTQLAALEAFYPAEDYHQDFLVRNPDYPYIVYWDLPKLKELEKRFPNLISTRSP